MKGMSKTIQYKPGKSPLIRSLICEKCPFRAKTKATLNYNALKRHGGRFQCLKCRFFGNDQRNLVIHQRKKPPTLHLLLLHLQVERKCSFALTPVKALQIIKITWLQNMKILVWEVKFASLIDTREYGILMHHNRYITVIYVILVQNS